MDVLIETGLRLFEVAVVLVDVPGLLGVVGQHGGCDGAGAVRTGVCPQVGHFPRQPAVFVQREAGSYTLVPGLFGGGVVGHVARSVVHLQQGDGDPERIVREVVSESRSSAPRGVSFVVVSPLVVPAFEIASDECGLVGVREFDTVVVVDHGSHGVRLLPVAVSVVVLVVVFAVGEYAVGAVSVRAAVESLDECRRYGIGRFGPVDFVIGVGIGLLFGLRIGDRHVVLFTARGDEGEHGEYEQGSHGFIEFHSFRFYLNLYSCHQVPAGLSAFR